MKKIYFLSVLLSTFLGSQCLHAQDTPEVFNPKPISAEEFVGDKRQFFQILVNKAFTEKKKTGILSLSSYAADYNDKLTTNEFQNTTLVYHRLFGDVGINSGVAFTSSEGMENFVGLQYMHQGKTLSLIYLPSYYFLNAQKISNFALIAQSARRRATARVVSGRQLSMPRDLAPAASPE
jgi:hypothetical protein